MAQRRKGYRAQVEALEKGGVTEESLEQTYETVPPPVYKPVRKNKDRLRRILRLIRKGIVAGGRGVAIGGRMRKKK